MLDKFFLGLAALTAFTSAVPFPQSHVPQTLATTSSIQARAGDPENCPGYSASNVVKTDSTLTADLTLAGNPCNVYSDDIKNLKLEVEYQTGKFY